ncbi:alcohol dehydrogenase superfamily protein [Tanacetum coccineum]|uniref:Alcohol dehydrogenase superfamily protein n=1 Tax=Tanacetum coccineum TaxID=301880 RepID=A0ABQ5CBA0_9ASTR
MSKNDEDVIGSLDGLTHKEIGVPADRGKKFEAKNRVLKWEDIEIADLKEGEIGVKNKAIGVNFINIITVPVFIWVEAVGVVTAIRPGVNDLKVGDVVYHSGSVTGTYTKEQIVLADKATPLPPIDHLVVASVMERINHSFLCQNLVQGKIHYA